MAVMTRPSGNWRFRDNHVPGVYILCRARHGGLGAKRCGSILIAEPGESFWAPSREDPDVWEPVSDIHIALYECPDHGPLEVDSRDLAAAIAKARREKRVVPLRVTPTG
jgi:hypothetical protein